MKLSKKKTVIIVSVALVCVAAIVVSIFGLKNGWLKKSTDMSVENTTVSTASNTSSLTTVPATSKTSFLTTVPATSKTSFLTKGFSSGERLANIGEISVIADTESIYLLNEKTGETDIIMYGCFQDIAFNGETVIFQKFESETPTSFDPDKIYNEAGKLYKYDVKSEKVEFLFYTNWYYIEPVFFDKNYLYYCGSIGDEASKEYALIKYNLKNKNSETISNVEYDVIINISYSDGYILFGTDDLHLYNISTGKINLIDAYWYSAFVKDGKVYYGRNETDKLPGGVLSCNIDGTDKKLLKPDNSDNWHLTYNSTQIVCSDDNGNYTLFNFDTGKKIEFKIPNYQFFYEKNVSNVNWVTFVNDKLVIYSLSQDYKTFTTYSLNNDGTLKKLKEAETDFNINDSIFDLRVTVTDNMIHTYGMGTEVDENRYFKLEAVK